MIQNFLRKLLTVDLPSLMVLPKRLEISVPPSITSLAEAAVGRDTIMRAVASAVLEADALEQALDNVLPLGRQGPAGGVELPESFKGELSVSLREARDLDVPAVPWQSNPYCRLVLGSQVRVITDMHASGPLCTLHDVACVWSRALGRSTLRFQRFNRQGCRAR